MARKRMIDPSYWRDEKIGACRMMERLLFIGLWNFAEDSGVGRASPLLIKADIFPYDTLREADIQAGLDRLSSLGLIRLYESGGQRYYHVVNFKKHQTINKPSQCNLPLPEDYGSAPVAVTPQEKKREEKEKGTEPLPPSAGRFDGFWQAYPKKKAKAEAEKAWRRMGGDPLADLILTALELQKKSDQWTREGGRYIPHPATWLNQRRWEDEENTGAAPREYAIGEEEPW